jgi:Uma2 family endonuclease
MATITPTPTQLPAPSGAPALYRFTVDEYERMVLDDPRVELLDGHVVRKMGKKPPHIWAVSSMLKALTPLLPSGCFLRKEDPVRIPEYDEPEPDVAVIRGREEDYRSRIPEATNLALLAEVSDTTLSQDRGKKLSAYAGGAIPVYWIVNLVDRQVEVYTGPGPGGYQSHVDFKPGQQVPVVIDGRQLGTIAVDDILP